MKFRFLFYLFFCFQSGFAQTVAKPKSANQFKDCTTTDCKIKNSFLTAEYYLEQDDIDASQKWLNTTKDLVNPEVSDSTECYIHSLQSELFYYNGLFQFGKNEARKQIVIAKKINDSLMIADGYFFLAINQIELSDYSNAEKSLWTAIKYHPQKKLSKRLRAIIQKEHIYNNLAQVKIRMSQPSSALWYNIKAYEFAQKTNSKRGIPNVEQTFGEIYFSQKKWDSAAYYFTKSTASAFKSGYYDIALVNYGFLLQCEENSKIRDGYYDKGVLLMQNRIVNSAFKRLFYSKALKVYRDSDKAKTIYIQNKIIEIDAQTQAKGNLYFQNFTDQYIQNEKKLLSLEVQKLKRQKDLVFFQLLIALLLVLLLFLAVVNIRRKNKINSTLLNQKNEISKDLHDDIGSGISSILIHSDLLQKSAETDEKQKLLVNKISVTSKEISQRINTFVWSLNAENNTLRDFIEYLKHYAENLFEGTALELEFNEIDAFEKQFLIDGKTRKNLFFSIKEIFNNALKHSDADKITINIKITEKKNLLVEIKDNGKGISSQNYFGNGLKNLQKRVEEMKGTIHIESSDGLLTKILIPISE